MQPGQKLPDTAASGEAARARRLLVTAGPTHEPIDAVRFIGNRSSGRLGVDLADVAAKAGWQVTLLLGPTHLAPTDPRVRLARFQTAADLGALLAEHQPHCDVLVMAAAVADFTPAAPTDGGKLRRADGPVTLALEPTEDLLAACAARRPPGQLLVGFALEPRESLLESAREKLRRKGIDLIVANPLGTMESPAIEATLLDEAGVVAATAGPIPKVAFAAWLLKHLEDR